MNHAKPRAWLFSLANRGNATALPHPLLPTRSALNRVGLERHWNNVVPLTGTDRVLMISMSASSERVVGNVGDGATTTTSVG